MFWNINSLARQFSQPSIHKLFRTYLRGGTASPFIRPHSIWIFLLGVFGIGLSRKVTEKNWPVGNHGTCLLHMEQSQGHTTARQSAVIRARLCVNKSGVYCEKQLVLVLSWCAVRPSPLGMSATVWPFVMMSGVVSRMRIDRRNQNTRRKRARCHYVHHKIHLTWPGQLRWQAGY